jgi:rubrerythrin
MTREEAKRVLYVYRAVNLVDESHREAFDTAIKALEQESKKGHWIMTSDYLTTAYGSVDYVKCSCCGEDSLEEGDYCPNCGADMRGEE